MPLPPRRIKTFRHPQNGICHPWIRCLPLYPPVRKRRKRSPRQRSPRKFLQRNLPNLRIKRLYNQRFFPNRKCRKNNLQLGRALLLRLLLQWSLLFRMPERKRIRFPRHLRRQRFRHRRNLKTSRKQFPCKRVPRRFLLVQAQSSSAGKVGSSASSQYRIGPEDVLNVSVWGDKEMTMEVIVRPDGKISLPLVQDIQAEGLTASELAD